MSINKDAIFISMEPRPEQGTNLYKIECSGCSRECTWAFYSPRKLSFAFVGKLAGGFSSPCKRLVAEEAQKDRAAQDGQASLISDAND